jgi:hypothetical protein
LAHLLISLSLPPLFINVTTPTAPVANPNAYTYDAPPAASPPFGALTTIARYASLYTVPWNEREGISMHYYKGMFAKVARNRGIKLSTRVDGYASTRNCSRVKKHDPWIVYARIQGGPTRTYQIVDCSHPAHLQKHTKWGLIIEVDWASAVRESNHGRTKLLRTGRAPARIVDFGRLSWIE